MKRLFTLFFTAFVIYSCSNNNNGWKLVWEDDFNGNELDYSVWSKIPRGEADWNRYMSDYDGLYKVDSGYVTLLGIVNDVLPEDTAKFMTGGIYTNEKKAFSEGRIEIKAKLSSAQGYWPAFWMLPQNASWPMGGEIDIMEHLNHDSVVYQTVHTNYTYNLNIKDNPKPGVVPKHNHGDWNVYGLEMYRDSLVFFVNDKRTMAYPRIETDKEGQFPFADSPFYLLLDSQLGGSWVGKVDPEQLPVEMKIDWVKFYQK